MLEFHETSFQFWAAGKEKGQLDNLNHPSKIQLPQMPLFSPVQKIPKVDQTSRKDARTSKKLLDKLKQCIRCSRGGMASFLIGV